MSDHNRMTAEEIATQIRASGQIVERREIPERSIEQEAEKIKQFSFQVATEAVEEEKNEWEKGTTDRINAEYHGIFILKNIKKRLNDAD